MKVLVVCDSHPLPASDGMRLHLAGLLPHLSRHHDVRLITLTRAGDEVDASALRRLGVQRWRGVPASRTTRWGRLRQEVPALLRRRPVLVQQTLESGLAEAVAAEVARDRPDVVHLQPGWVTALAAHTSGVPVVAVPLDAAAPNLEAQAASIQGLRRLLVRRELRRTKAFEQRAYAGCEAVVVVSERDAEILRRQDRRLQPYVVPNGIDSERWRRPSTALREPDLVVLTGALSYPPNVDAAVFAAREVMPRLLALRPGARLALVGRDPAPEVQALAGDRVTVTGTVPDIAPWLWRAGAYLCPMRTGTGIKNKLLEALAAGCPVVATPFATGGLDVLAERDLLVAADAAGLAEALARVLADASEADRLGKSAAERAGAQSWARAAAQFGAAYASAGGPVSGGLPPP